MVIRLVLVSAGVSIPLHLNPSSDTHPTPIRHPSDTEVSLTLLWEVSSVTCMTGQGRACIIPIYGHTIMHYTHTWSYDPWEVSSVTINGRTATYSGTFFGVLAQKTDEAARAHTMHALYPPMHTPCVPSTPPRIPHDEAARALHPPPPSTLNPQPSTLNPPPSTLNP